MIPLGLLLFPLFEIATGIAVIQEFGFANAFFVWLLTSILGFGLFRSTSARISLGVAQALRRGESPGQGAIESALLGLAGLLLLLPGYLSDVFGFLILFRPVRRLIARRLLMKIPRSGVAGATAADMVIDVEATKVE